MVYGYRGFFEIEIESKKMLEILKSKKRNLSFKVVDKSKVCLKGSYENEDGYVLNLDLDEAEGIANQDMNIDDFLENFFYSLEEIDFSTDDLEFVYECQENIEQIIEDTTLIIYKFEENFFKEAKFSYVNLFKELYPNVDIDYFWEAPVGEYYKTIKYDKKNADNPWTIKQSIEFDY